MSTERWVSVGQSTDTDSYAAGVEAATLALAGRSAALLITFCSDSHDLERLLAGIDSVSGGTALIVHKKADGSPDVVLRQDPPFPGRIGRGETVTIWSAARPRERSRPPVRPTSAS